jgi:hypothetical protein
MKPDKISSDKTIDENPAGRKPYPKAEEDRKRGRLERLKQPMGGVFAGS